MNECLMNEMPTANISFSLIFLVPLHSAYVFLMKRQKDKKKSGTRIIYKKNY